MTTVAMLEGVHAPPPALSGVAHPMYAGAAGGVAGAAAGGVAGAKPVPMKLFATWEVDRTPPNCIPRLCTLTLTRLVLTKPLGTDLNSVIIAVKMQSSKRTLRSNEIELPPSGMLDTELELTFSLQYPHFLKREGNQLHIMLQRRKKYKNRTILGFKTLATGTINMSQVLQKQMDLELELFGDLKEKTAGSAIGKVYMLSLSSQPVDHEDNTARNKSVQGGDLYSDDEEDFSSVEEGSDSEPMLDLDPPSASGPSHRRFRKGPRGGGALAKGLTSARQRNLKQKFVALLKKFKVTDPDELEKEQVSLDQKLSEGTVDPAEIEDLFDQLEDLSDSGPDVDTISVGSTPKPSLKPFFNSSRNIMHEAKAGGHFSSIRAQHMSEQTGSDRVSDDSSKENVSDSHPDTLTDPEFSDPQIITSSPPQSGDEVKKTERRSRLFSSREKQSLMDKSVLKHSMSGAASQMTATTVSSNPTSTANSASTYIMSASMAASVANRVEKTQSGAAAGTEPRKVLLEQLSRIFPTDSSSDLSLPDQIILANTLDKQGAHLAAKLAENTNPKIGLNLICTSGPADVRATLNCLVGKIQKFCNTQTVDPPSIRVGLIGSDTFVNSVLRPYVEVFSSRPPDWQGYLKFYIIPLGSNAVSKYIGSSDPDYASLFLHDSWRELLEKAEPEKTEVNQMVYRIRKYLEGSAENSIMQLPVAEAMVTYKEKSCDEESSQVFIPFVSDVRVVGDTGDRNTNNQHSLDGDDVAIDLTSSPQTAISSQSQSLTVESRLTPPSSPHVGKDGPRSSDFFSDPVDLQLDYWVSSGPLSTLGLSPDPSPALLPSSSTSAGFGGVSGGDRERTLSSSKSRGGESGSSKAESKKGLAGLGDTKNSIKPSIRFMLIQRSANPVVAGGSPAEVQGGNNCTFAMQYWLKEKKQKGVIRLGKKKEKDSSSDNIRSQNVDGITRLICLSKGHTPLKVHIDGLEWQGVKFFQLSSQWQTHIKFFPVATFKAHQTTL